MFRLNALVRCELVRIEIDAVERLELFQEVPLQLGAVAEIRPQELLEFTQLGGKVPLDNAFFDGV